MTVDERIAALAAVVLTLQPTADAKRLAIRLVARDGFSLYQTADPVEVAAGLARMALGDAAAQPRPSEGPPEAADEWCGFTPEDFKALSVDTRFALITKRDAAREAVKAKAESVRVDGMVYVNKPADLDDRSPLERLQWANAAIAAAREAGKIQ